MKLPRKVFVAPLPAPTPSQRARRAVRDELLTLRGDATFQAAFDDPRHWAHATARARLAELQERARKLIAAPSEPVVMPAAERVAEESVEVPDGQARLMIEAEFTRRVEARYALGRQVELAVQGVAAGPEFDEMRAFIAAMRSAAEKLKADLPDDYTDNKHWPA